MSSRRKCRIIRNGKGISPFIKGDLFLARNREEFIVLFDAEREVIIDNVHDIVDSFSVQDIVDKGSLTIE